jgi:predicted GIY-YIG superfamily endonuclease
MRYVYIYALKCPISHSPRYVGKSSNPIKRYNTHMQKANYLEGKTYKQNWIKLLVSQ